MKKLTAPVIITVITMLTVTAVILVISSFTGSVAPSKDVTTVTPPPVASAHVDVDITAEALTEIHRLHETLDVQLGYGRIHKFDEAHKDVYFAEIFSLDVMDANTYTQLASEMVNVDGAQSDMETMKELVAIARETKSSRPLAYMHRIIHDLDNEFKGTNAQETYFGASSAVVAKGKENIIVGEIEKYIDGTKKGEDTNVRN